MRRGLRGGVGGGRGGGGGEGEGGGGEGEGGRRVAATVGDGRVEGVEWGEVGGWGGDEGGGGDLGAPRTKGAWGQGKIRWLRGGEKVRRISTVAHTEGVDWREWFEP